MGEVFLARQISLDRMVALKTLTKELAKKGDFVARFEREAKSMAKIDHPNVVKIYAVDSYKGIHFAAIEYIDGQSVQKWLDHLGRFSIADAVHIAIICGEALKHADPDWRPIIPVWGKINADLGTTMSKIITENLDIQQAFDGLAARTKAVMTEAGYDTFRK